MSDPSSSPGEEDGGFTLSITARPEDIDELGHVNIEAGDTVTGHTWISEPPQGARFWRNVRFTGSDGKTRVAARTSWAIIDRESQRPVRVPASLAALFLGGQGAGIAVDGASGEG